MRGRDRDLPHTTPFLSALCYRFHFLEFCRRLRAAVPSLSLWAAGAWPVQSPPDWLTVEDKLTIPLRNPPAVLREVEKSRFIKDSVHTYRPIPSYNQASFPAPTDGPRVVWLQHNGQDEHSTDGGPQDCEQCGREIARLLKTLIEGEPGRCFLYCWHR